MQLSWIAVVLLAATSSADGDLSWWRTATFYEVFPNSFKDSDGDGIGDVRGIIEKADYFKEIGVDAIWLSSLNTPPMVKSGCDQSTLISPDSIFATVEDIEDLMTKLHEIGVKFLLDFVPNHTSDEHEWFKMSVNTSHPLHQDYKDFYVWRDAKGFTPEGIPVPPNNWLSVVGGSAWTWCKTRQQFFLHQFLAEQPDLNFRNPNVVSNMTEIVQFWLDKGVDGFRVDVAPHLFEDANFTDEQPLPGRKGDGWLSLNHTYTKHQPETFQLLSYWSDLMYQRILEDNKHRVMLVEVYAEAHIAKRYYGKGQNTFQIPLNFMLMMRGSSTTQPQELLDIISEWMGVVPNERVPSWVVGDHYLTRVSNLYGEGMVDTINLLTGVLPGVKVVYFGEELGMDKSPVSWNQTVDPWAKYQGPNHYQKWSRDFIRTPMQWDNTLSTGFSSNATTWLPVNPNYWWLNVAAQRAAPVSHLKVFQAVAKVRKDPVLQRGNLHVLVSSNETLLVARSYNESYYVLVVNLGSGSFSYTSKSLTDRQGRVMDMIVVAASVNSGYHPGFKLKESYLNITLISQSAILLRSSVSPSSSAAPHFTTSNHTVVYFILFVMCNVLSILFLSIGTNVSFY